MCGRARCSLRPDDISRACYCNNGPVRTVHMDRYRPSYNVSPGSNLPVVRREDGADGEGVVLHCMKWGLIPSFTKKTEKPDHYKMFNARSESICERASFRRLVPKSRCLIAVEGFYEWKKDGTKKQPYYVHFKDGRPLVFAALYDSWENSEGEKLYTFTIITTSSSSALEWLHDRMPVILGDKGSTDTWLYGSSSSNFDSLLKPYEVPDLVWYPVTPAMGKVSFDGPECINEIQLKTEGKNSITKFFLTKESKKEELNPKDTSSYDKSVKTNLPESVKKEPESKEDTAIKKEELNPEDTSSYDTSVKTDLLESVKKEPERNQDAGQPSFAHDSKCGVSTFSQEGASKGQTKRDYEEFSADCKPGTYETDKISSPSPVKKKINPKSSLDKQPTLFSYFGKS